VCSDSFQVLVGPFGTRRFPVHRGGSTHFSIRTQGQGIVRFGSEAPPSDVRESPRQ
jgi:hypothetical protein